VKPRFPGNNEERRGKKPETRKGETTKNSNKKKGLGKDERENRGAEVQDSPETSNSHKNGAKSGGEITKGGGGQTRGEKQGQLLERNIARESRVLCAWPGRDLPGAHHWKAAKQGEEAYERCAAPKRPKVLGKETGDGRLKKGPEVQAAGILAREKNMGGGPLQAKVRLVALTAKAPHFKKNKPAQPCFGGNKRELKGQGVSRCLESKGGRGSGKGLQEEGRNWDPNAGLQEARHKY